MRLHVLYRTHPGGNSKARPPWFDRATAFESLRDSLAALGTSSEDVTLTLVADGGLPAELTGPRVRGVPVAEVRGGRASSSLRAALAVAADVARREPSDTLIWLAEDDYLYRPEAMTELVAAATAIPEASYLALYTPDDRSWHAEHPTQPDRVAPALPGGPVDVGGSTWRPITKTTSTFGVRAADLLADRWLIDAGSRVGAPFDMATWYALQGHAPFPARHVLRDLAQGPSARELLKVASKPPLRVAYDLVAALARRHRVLIAPTTDLATHAELSYLAPGSDWAARADQLRAGDRFA